MSRSLCYLSSVIVEWRLTRVAQMSERAITSVEELLRKDADDESLRRYKEQLLGDAAHGDRGGAD